MNRSLIHVHRGGPLVALVAPPNCGKTALFNPLTGSRQKVANYAGVTVERKEGRFVTAAGNPLHVLDLPGAHSLHPRSPDERVAVDVLQGRAVGEKRPDLVACVMDTTNLRLVLAVKRTRQPSVVALNVADLAATRGIVIDAVALGRELGLPVVPTVAVQADGAAGLRTLLDEPKLWRETTAGDASPWQDLPGDHEAVRGMLGRLGLEETTPHEATERIDRIVLDPVLGPLLLAVVLFLVFQAVLAWPEAPMGWIEAATGWLGETVGGALPEGGLRRRLVDGIVAGVGGVIVFPPQIVILFFFILVLEERGYLPRAAFLLERLMGCVVQRKLPRRCARRRPRRQAEARQSGLHEHALHGAVMYPQLPGDRVDAPLVDVVVAKDPRFQIRGGCSSTPSVGWARIGRSRAGRR